MYIYLISMQKQNMCVPTNIERQQIVCWDTEFCNEPTWPFNDLPCCVWLEKYAKQYTHLQSYTYTRAPSFPANKNKQFFFPQNYWHFRKLNPNEDLRRPNHYHHKMTLHHRQRYTTICLYLCKTISFCFLADKRKTTKYTIFFFFYSNIWHIMCANALRTCRLFFIYIFCFY